MEFEKIWTGVKLISIILLLVALSLLGGIAVIWALNRIFSLGLNYDLLNVVAMAVIIAFFGNAPKVQA